MGALTLVLLAKSVHVTWIALERALPFYLSDMIRRIDIARWYAVPFVVAALALQMQSAEAGRLTPLHAKVFLSALFRGEQLVLGRDGMAHLRLPHGQHPAKGQKQKPKTAFDELRRTNWLSWQTGGEATERKRLEQLGELLDEALPEPLDAYHYHLAKEWEGRVAENHVVSLEQALAAKKGFCVAWTQACRRLLKDVGLSPGRALYGRLYHEDAIGKNTNSEDDVDQWHTALAFPKAEGGDKHWFVDTFGVHQAEKKRIVETQRDNTDVQFDAWFIEDGRVFLIDQGSRFERIFNALFRRIDLQPAH